jgi:heptaprenylglyceryl phosphate synthase
LKGYPRETLTHHELADVDAHPVLHNLLGGGIQALPMAKDMLQALARPVVTGAGVVVVVVVVRSAVPRERVGRAGSLPA